MITGLVLIAVALSIGLLFGRGSTAATGKQPAAGAGQSTTQSSAPATSTDEAAVPTSTDESSAPATSTAEARAPTSTDAGSSASDTPGTAPTEPAPDTTGAP